MANDDEIHFGGRAINRATRDRLFALLRDFDNRDRRVVRRREEWARLGHVLQRNGAELTAFLDIAAARASLAEASVVSEAERLVFNFAAAVSARVDYYRRAMKHESETFQRRYEALVAPLGASDEHVVLTALRQYVTHVGLSPLSSVEFAIPDGSATGFYLRRDELAKCDEARKPRGQAALSRMAPHIELRPLVERYRLLAAEQDRAVQTLFAEHHANELAADAEAWANVQRAWRDAGFGAWVGA